MNWIIERIQSNGEWSMFVGGLVEEVFVPLPSPLVSMAGGAFLVEGDSVILSLLRKVVFPFAVGATLGSYFVYLIAFWGGRFLIEKMKGYLGFGWTVVEKTRNKFIRGPGDELAIFLLRAIPVCPVSVVSGVCGAVRINWKEFTLFTFLGLVVRSFILGFLGWQAGETYQSLAEGLDRIEDLVFVLIFLVLFGGLCWGYYKRTKLFGE